MVSYYTIQPDEGEVEILSRIQRDFWGASFVPVMAPIKLMGNAKVLTLKIRGTNFIIKVDGPGFIIKRLYDNLLFGKILNRPKEKD